MRTRNLTKNLLACFAASAFLTNFALAQGVDVKAAKGAGAPSGAESRPQIQVPNRPSTSLFQGEQGKQKTEIYFDPASQVVTVKMLVQDPNGYFIPNIRRDNFAVYENGTRQHNATVEIEHAPVSLAVLMEWGGRYQALNKALADEVPQAAHQVLDELGRQDKVAIFRYGDGVDRLADFSSGHEALDGLFSGLNRPELSELNFYDGLTSTLGYMKRVNGRKAVILISSGIDTFSKAKYEDVLSAARDCGTPIYVVNLGPALHGSVGLSSNEGPYARLDWKRAERELQEIARASGGRLYSPGSMFDLSGVYDDIMENLRVRYVITYKSGSDRDLSSARTVRVELVDSRTGGPLEIIDASGKAVRSKIFVEDSYIPRSASVASVNITSKVQQE
jgi:Ca-activated chloride channel homolog